MTLQLINGHFTADEASQIIQQMIQVKIKILESRITDQSTEEDFKMRKSRIRQLQSDLALTRNFIAKQNGNIAINSTIILN